MNADELAQAVQAAGVARAVAAGCAARPDERGGWSREVGGAAHLLFDLASVTKPMTAVAIAAAGIDPATPLGALVVEARGTASEGVPLELLLAHRAGLAAHRALYAPLLSGAAVEKSAALREAADARRPEALGSVPAAGFAPLYSDLGYVLAGEAVARAVGARDAGEAIDRLVLLPLGIAAQAGTVRDLASRGVDGPFAPTEEVPWRGGLVSGAVHDENAWAMTGRGGSGHAGIFGTIDAALTFGSAVLDALEGRGPLGDCSLEWLVRQRPGGTLRAGFDGKSDSGSSAGTRMGPRTFGHLGFTGTSLWLDPDAHVAVGLLTNRVFPTREHLAIREARPWAHDALFDRAVLLPDRG
ncbi:MAG TPA: serine hydrolase domain-containing protein [Polyangiaceae bacterium]|jgi:CubicO group peptidase (beta-lactamase class C family)|nr:serine hydrolase domain-containing protein [Polyangiaceae bacterium]